jgi:probable rRNA maturation factor
MNRHKVYVRHSGVKAAEGLSVQLIKRCVRMTLHLEGLHKPHEVNALITHDRGIREINKQFRGIDEPTDVLSFPMMERGDIAGMVASAEAAGAEAAGAEAAGAEAAKGLEAPMLGDFVLSSQRVRVQAEENGHSPERETAHLTIHAVLHLLGYDHEQEHEEKIMRDREKAILAEIF